MDAFYNSFKESISLKDDDTIKVTLKELDNSSVLNLRDDFAITVVYDAKRDEKKEGKYTDI